MWSDASRQNTVRELLLNGKKVRRVMWWAQPPPQTSLIREAALILTSFLNILRTCAESFFLSSSGIWLVILSKFGPPPTPICCGSSLSPPAGSLKRNWEIRIRSLRSSSGVRNAHQSNKIQVLLCYHLDSCFMHATVFKLDISKYLKVNLQ